MRASSSSESIIRVGSPNIQRNVFLSPGEADTAARSAARMANCCLIFLKSVPQDGLRSKQIFFNDELLLSHSIRHECHMMQ